MKTPVASIIVCTHNRASMLSDCLRSVIADSSLVARELIVVNNASTDTTWEAVSDVQRLGSPMSVRYVMEPKLGLSRARNCGTAMARGEFLLFTDDDVLVEDGWADALVGSFSDPAVGMVGGRVLPRWPVDPPAWLQGGPQAAVLSLSDLGSAPRLLGDAEAPAGANMAIRARCLMGLRYAFDPSLGPRGELKFDYDEVNIAQRIRSEYRVVYQPHALVYHRIQPERMNRAWLRRTYLQHGFGAERHERATATTQRHLTYRVAHFALTAVRAWRWRRRNDRSVVLDATAIDAELQTFAWVGRTTERLVGRFPSASNWLAERLA